MTASNKKIMLVAGGTGGHVFPAIAVASELLDLGNSVRFVTDRRGLKYIKTISNPMVLPMGNKSAGALAKVLLLWQFLLSFLISLKEIITFKPDVVVGFSGFPTFPTLVAAIILGRKIAIHEQNAYLGKVNRWLARYVDQIFISTANITGVPSYTKTLYTGLPVRKEIQQLSSHSYNATSNTINILVTGGSQGAQSFSSVVPAAIKKLAPELQKQIQVTQQVRESDIETVKREYKSSDLKSVNVLPFIEDMADELQKATLVISRAGASTIAELCTAGKPAIMIPYPYATDDHQAYNAREITKLGGGWMLAQKDFSVDNLYCILLDLIMHRKKLLFASERLKAGSKKGGIKFLVKSILSL